MIPLEEGFLIDMALVGSALMADVLIMYQGVTQSKEFETIDITRSRAAIIVFQSSAGEILETGYDLCDS